MTNKRIPPLIMILGFFIVATLFPREVSSGQDDDVENNLRIPQVNHVQIIVTEDGSSLVGRITWIGKDEIQFETDLGVVTIPIAKIEGIQEVPKSSIKRGEYWFPDPNSTRLFFAPTGRNLKKGGGYFCSYYLFFPGVAYGITDNFSIGGGVSLFPGVDLSEQLFYFTPKFGLKVSSSFNFSAGALLVRAPDGDESQLAGILYGMGTVGPADGSLTIGLGYGFVGSDFADRPVIVVGGNRRLSKEIAILSENWIIPDMDTPVVSLGLRFFGKSLSGDFALINTLKDPIFPGVPYTNFVYNF